jgi:hypothetical protein
MAARRHRGSIGLARRGAVGAIALFAFVFQILAGAAHWHWPPAAQLSVAHAAIGDLPNHPQKAPLKSEPCQLCQAMSGSARFLSASALILRAPQSAVFAWQTADTQAAIRIRLSHSWRGRAPPSSIEIV